MKNKDRVSSVIWQTVRRKKALSLGIVCAVAGAIAFSLFPPLILGKIIDSLTAGQSVSIGMAGLYFALLALAGLLESLREGGLTLFGQKITHALRSRLMGKMVRLSADTLSHIEPGALVSRFVGDVDAVENLFTSGIVSMFADACKIISILAVVWFQNRGLALILVLLLPFLFWFTRHVQKNMLAAQLDNRRAVSRAAGHVPESLHNIRTIHTLGKEAYMEQRYDDYIEDSYRAMEKTNFYDDLLSGNSDSKRRGCGRGHAAIRLRQRQGADAVWHVGWHGGGGNQLYLPDFHPRGKPGHGNSDHPVRRRGRTPHQ